MNVRGRKGWLFGDADFIAFDRGWFWTIVNKQRLIEALSEKVDWSEVLEYGDEKALQDVSTEGQARWSYVGAVVVHYEN